MWNRSAFRLFLFHSIQQTAPFHPQCKLQYPHNFSENRIYRPVPCQFCVIPIVIHSGVRKPHGLKNGIRRLIHCFGIILFQRLFLGICFGRFFSRSCHSIFCDPLSAALRNIGFGLSTENSQQNYTDRCRQNDAGQKNPHRLFRFLLHCSRKRHLRRLFRTSRPTLFAKLRVIRNLRTATLTKHTSNLLRSDKTPV